MRALKWIGIVVGGLLGLVIVALGVVYALTQRRIGRHYEVAGHEVAIPSDSLILARGEHIATVRACAGCHGEGLAGAVFIDVPPVATLHAANLTTGKGEWPPGMPAPPTGNGRSARGSPPTAAPSFSCRRTSSTR